MMDGHVVRSPSAERQNHGERQPGGRRRPRRVVRRSRQRPRGARPPLGGRGPGAVAADRRGDGGAVRRGVATGQAAVPARRDRAVHPGGAGSPPSRAEPAPYGGRGTRPRVGAGGRRGLASGRGGHDNGPRFLRHGGRLAAAPGGRPDRRGAARPGRPGTAERARDGGGASGAGADGDPCGRPGAGDLGSAGAHGGAQGTTAGGCPPRHHPQGRAPARPPTDPSVHQQGVPLCRPALRHLP